MHKLVNGVHHFQSQIFSSQRDLFERLAKEQAPDALFITCSDSRINPNLITQTEPGELFILRNAGNLVPPHGSGSIGEQATIEFAITGLGIKDIIICGHTQCGAVKALLNRNGELQESMPAMYAWLNHAECTRRLMKEKYAALAPAEKCNVAIQENVLVQLENLRTHPTVASGISRGVLKLHAWVYKIETGQVFAYDPQHSQFVPILEAHPVPPAAWLDASRAI